MNKRALKRLYFEDFDSFNEIVAGITSAPPSIEGALDQDGSDSVFNAAEQRMMINASERIRRLMEKVYEVEEELEADGHSPHRDPQAQTYL